ncbi:MAG: hypothetical protein J6B34_01610 [Clostridia bacterium]|nr:hypothetical protein [Clostridia bacterium]
MKIKEGDLYKVVELFGRSFELRYGYYEEYERDRTEPIPIYPDLKKHPVYTKDGIPFVTQMQELCEYGKSKFKEGCCVDCEFYKDGAELIGLCTNKNNKKS